MIYKRIYTHGFTTKYNVYINKNLYRHRLKSENSTSSLNTLLRSLLFTIWHIENSMPNVNEKHFHTNKTSYLRV